ncbi:MAG: glycosyl transferase family 4 [Gallionellales bacterium RIFCSPLOWO2_12_FULL_59_22]|nr:MAG: glycosyl transferase family 4 [Gallionellales bacterium RIFCSPLOWO2_02_FULL_59_110]OGT14325.1 MAG: glycosyl transferase family 4 [Gallionellales bacterium RIFCSPLOWO2_12_FULL_59_22]
MTYYAPLVSALVTLVLTFVLMTGKTGLIVRDIPNERSLHSAPIPRVGGIALMAGTLSGWALLMPFLAWWVLLPAAGLFALSLLDDMRSLSPQYRLAGHFFAALVALLGAGVPLPWFVPLLLYIVWMTNLYNFMDGSDGLAGGMAWFGFGGYGIGAWLGGDMMFALLNFSVAAAALGFLVFNFHPAKVFMGDAGSIPLGFLAAMFGVSGWQAGYWPFWFPLLVFSPFAADATVTLFKRMRRGEKLSQAHRSHYYQHLVQMGWGHRNTAFAEYALMLLAGLSALWGIGLAHTGQVYLLLGWAALYLVLMASVDKRWREYRSAEKRGADA